MFWCSLYSAASTQADIFEYEVKPLICQVLKGFDANIFAYGAKGSGKTHTVIGTESDPGIILRTVRALLEARDQFLAGQLTGHEKQIVQSEIEMSFMELYKNSAVACDLLGPKGHEISIRGNHKGLKTPCPELVRVPIESNEQFIDRFRLASKERTTAHAMFSHQSIPSHAVLILYIRFSDGSNIFR